MVIDKKQTNKQTNNAQYVTQSRLFLKFSFNKIVLNTNWANEQTFQTLQNRIWSFPNLKMTPVYGASLKELIDASSTISMLRPHHGNGKMIIIIT